jgi:predicted nuclease with TOPRIM domain
MTNSPTLTYTLEEVLTRFEQKIDRQFADVNLRLDKIELRFDRVDERLNKLEIGQAVLTGEIKALDEKIDGIGKRLDNQEFINRGVLVAVIVALVGGAAKIFGWLPNN